MRKPIPRVRYIQLLNNPSKLPSAKGPRGELSEAVGSSGSDQGYAQSAEASGVGVWYIR